MEFNENTKILLNLSNEQHVPEFIESRQNNKEDLVTLGPDNEFLDEVSSLIDETSLLNSIIDKATKYVYGKGVISDLKDTIVNEQGKTYSDVIYRAINDYISFGAFAIQVRRNDLGDIKYIDSLDITRIRTNEKNSKLWYSKKWGKYSRNGICYNMFNGSREQSDSILYFKSPYERHTYGKAAWMSSLKDVVTLNSISDFNISTVNNAFAPSAIISLVEGKPDKEQAKEVEKEINKKFSGTKNASKVLVTFSDSKDTAPVITLMNPSDLTNQYIELQKTATKNLFAAFRMDPLLSGVRIDDGLFSQDSYEQTYALYNETEVKPTQEIIKRAFAKLGEEFKIDFIPFAVTFVGEESKNNTQE